MASDITEPVHEPVSGIPVPPPASLFCLRHPHEATSRCPNPTKETLQRSTKKKQYNTAFSLCVMIYSVTQSDPMSRFQPRSYTYE